MIKQMKEIMKKKKKWCDIGKRIFIQNENTAKGITLLALVITIIVIVVLSTVTINLLFGENGLITTAQGAKEETEQAQLEEQIELYMANFNLQGLGNSSYPNGVIDIADLPIEINGVKPKLGWIYVENNIIKEYELYFEDIYYLKTKNETYVRNYDSAKLINVKDYGAVGDGVTDDTVAIKEAVTYLNENGGILYFPIGTYMVSTTSNGESVIGLNSDKNIEVDFFKSTIQMQANEYGNYYVVNVENCTNVEIRNGDLVGDRIIHDYVSNPIPNAGGRGVRAINNTLCNILNMEISQMTIDAISTNTYSNGTTNSGTININDCNLHHCRRMGITITDSDIVNVKNTNIQYIGTTDGIEGVAPKSGIDIEPHYENGTINYVLLDNVNIENITTYGVVNSGRYHENVVKIDIVDSKIEKLQMSSAANIQSSELIDPQNIRKCTMEDSYIYKDANDFYLEDTIVNNCTFEGNDLSNGEYDNSFRILPTNATVTNSTFKNIQGKGNYANNSLAEFGILFAVNWGFTEESSNNIYDNCAIIIDNFTDNNSEIKNSYLYKRGNIGDLTLSTINLDDCTIKLDSNPLIFNNCNVEKCNFIRNTSLTGVYFTNSSFISDSITSQDYFSGTYVFDASTINVLGEISKTSFYNVEFLNNSKIILDRYSSVNLDIPKSNIGTDYTIECRGTEVID